MTAPGRPSPLLKQPLYAIPAKEPHDGSCDACDKRKQQSGQLHQGADQRANILRMVKAIGGARGGEDTNRDQYGKNEAEQRGPRPSRSEIYDKADCRQY